MGLHPEEEKLLAQIMYCAEYEQPIEKEVLFRGLPQLFINDIKMLSMEEQEKYLKPQYMVKTIDRPEMDKKAPFEEFAKEKGELGMKETTRMMRYFHHRLLSEFLEFYSPFIQERVTQFGYQTSDEYVRDLQLMDENKRDETEKQLVKEIQDLEKILEDIEALEIRSLEVQDYEITETPFPFTDPVYREEYLQKLKYTMKFKRITPQEVFFSILNTLRLEYFLLLKKNRVLKKGWLKLVLISKKSCKTVTFEYENSSRV
jgi:hypothetical protein